MPTLKMLPSRKMPTSRARNRLATPVEETDDVPDVAPEYDPEASQAEATLQRRRWTPPAPARMQYAPQVGQNTFDPGWRTPTMLPATALPAPMMINEAVADRARKYLEQGYQLPTDPSTGLPITPDNPAYAQYMDRTDVTPQQRARYKQIMGKDMPYYAARASVWKAKDPTSLWQMPINLETAPGTPNNMVRNRLGLMGEQAPGASRMALRRMNAGAAGPGPAAGPLSTENAQQMSGMRQQLGGGTRPGAAGPAAGPTPFYDRIFLSTGSEQPDYLTQQSMRDFNKTFAKERTRKQDFASLQDYDQWFSGMFDKTQGADFVGDEIKSKFYLKAMPQKIRDEYEATMAGRKLRTQDRELQGMIDEKGLGDRMIAFGGQTMEKPGFKEAEDFKRETEKRSYERFTQLEDERRKEQMTTAAEQRKQQAVIAAEQRKEQARTKEAERRFNELDEGGNDAWKKLSPTRQKTLARQMAELESEPENRSENLKVLAELEAKYFAEAKPEEKDSGMDRFGASKTTAYMKQTNPRAFKQWESMSYVLRELNGRQKSPTLQKAMTALQAGTPESIQSATAVLTEGLPSERQQLASETIQKALAAGNVNAVARVMLALDKLRAQKKPVANP